MPIYEYRCRNGHEFEVIQRMSDDPVEACEQCDAPVERVFHPVAVHFKGSGFYTTDYARKAKAGGPETSKDGGSGSSGDSGSGGESSSSSSSESGSKGESKAKAGDSKSSGDKAKSSSSAD